MEHASPPAPLRPNLRSEWLLDETVTFLNHGSFGATPRRVLDEQDRWRRRIEAEPVEILARRRPELLNEAKRPIGHWLGMAADDFGFVTNATEAVNAVLRSIELRPGDELLTTTHVYNAVRQAMRYVAGRANAAYREIDLPVPVRSPGEIESAVVAALGERTRLLVIDHVTSPTALLFPIERIAAACAVRGIDVLIDGAHAPGMLPLNVPATGAAYYAGNLHKWACAPKGTGFLWVRSDRQSHVHPVTISHHLGEGFPREFGWQGTRDFSAWLAAPKALEFLAEIGLERVMAYNHALAVWAQSNLCQRWDVQPISPADGHMLGSMATVPLPPPLDRLDEPTVAGLQQRLYSEFRVEVPVVRWGDRTFVRPCCQIYNVPADCERLADVICELVK
jgi:isopenicillin-N epimerase